MPMRKFLSYLKDCGCELVRDSGGHSIYRLGAKTVAVPRHKIISPGVKRWVCRELGIENKK